MVKSFYTNQRFFDSKNYPKGFSRYSDFTIKESQLLERHGCAFHELYTGIRMPQTADEVHFVSVCRGDSEPVYDEEKVWIKYLKCIRQPRRFHTLSGSKTNVEEIDDYFEEDGCV